MSYLRNESMLFCCRISARLARDPTIPQFRYRPYTTKQESTALVVVPNQVLTQRTPSFLLSKYRYFRKEKIVFTTEEWDEYLTLFLHSASPLGSFHEILNDALKQDNHDLLWWLLVSNRSEDAYAIFNRIFQQAFRPFALRTGIIYIGKLAEKGDYPRVFRLFRLFSIPRLISNRFVSQHSFTSLLDGLDKLIATEPKHAVEQLLQILLILGVKEDLVENGLLMIRKSVDQGYHYPSHFINRLIDAVLHSKLPMDKQIDYLVKITYFHELHLSPTTVDSLCRNLALDGSLRLKNLAYNHLQKHNIIMPISFLVDLINLNCQCMNSTTAWRIYDRLSHSPSPSVTVKLIRALSEQNNLKDVDILFSKHVTKLDLNDRHNQPIVHEILEHATRHKDIDLASQVVKYLIKPFSREVYTLLLALQLSVGKTDDSVNILSQMRENGVQPSRRDRNIILKSLLKENPEKGFAMAQEMSGILTYGGWCSILNTASEIQRQDIVDWAISHLGGRETMTITAFNILLKPLSFEAARSQTWKRCGKINYITLRILLHKAKSENNVPGVLWTVNEMKRYGWRPSGGEAIEWVKERAQQWNDNFEKASQNKKKKLAPGLWIYDL
ncbi:hypothetical protein NEOLI_001582 [Neolecta irregularis DAH-3]|uniref:Pentatricopeptide repeat-containing protein-mitochondrial domain-containing protein n=1 Tax=Neolecta irregularis (strain DAH-3) TaxID=1198029 RepID=A0A1U7LIG1_NEOID|nr:hypothetical protein NEOLI_001582 [Neolecta irregularis DAH-3]|eukprot:OLL22383.1 hypothetical protein NEOLI_001582 [Neolecta irregularis DAH-3]